MRKRSRIWLSTIALIMLSIAACNVKNESSIHASLPVSNGSFAISPSPAAIDTEDTTIKETTSSPSDKKEKKYTIKNNFLEYEGKTYTIVEVDGGDLSGERLPNVAVDIGYGERAYWALTNNYGQLVYVIADEIVLQDEENEPVLANGRYYEDEAKVPGVERPDLDEGHVIADALGGVSNAYNITPQNSTLNRYGNQAYMEKIIRDAGGCTDFLATITYPDTKTQIPQSYRYEYVLKGERILDEFDNIDSDKANEALTQTLDNTDGSLTPTPSKDKKVVSPTPDSSKTSVTKTPSKDKKADSFDEEAELARIDTNHNGKVTIAEAKAAGYSMPIYSDHWLYKYMDDRDKDGMVGE